MLGFVRNMRTAKKIYIHVYSGFKLIKSMIFFTETSEYFLGNSIIVIHTSCANLISVSHMLKDLFVAHHWYPVILLMMTSCIHGAGNAHPF